MRRILRHRPSPAMVIACIALTIALGGTSYAAVALPRNSVGTVQLKRNAVTSLKVKNRSLLAVDFRRGQLPRGARGPQGLQGIQGIQGVQGIQGIPGPFPDGDLPAGKTVRGTYAIGRFDTGATDSGFAVDAIQFGFRFQTPPTPRIIPFGGVPPAECPGTVLVPEAAAGNLCVYEGFATNSSGLSAFAPDSVAGAGRTGAILRTFSPTDGALSTSIGSWAATPATGSSPAAPLSGPSLTGE